MWNNSWIFYVALLHKRKVVIYQSTNLNPMKAPDFDVLTAVISKKFENNSLVKQTKLINASIQLKHLHAS